MVAWLGGRAGLRTWPHVLRHTAVTQALQLTNGDFRKVARFSRHADIRTIQHYDDNREDLGGQVAQMVALAL
jgi:integrase/recombinase XerC